MCGICGLVATDGRPASPERVRGMMNDLRHRGPDDDGCETLGPVGLGFVRLSILDLSDAGHQPMWSADRRSVVVYNGEVYNYIELRKELASLGHVFRTGTDTEVVLAAWTEWGRDALERFNGMWAFAIYDLHSRKVTLARDRYGIKPLYYSHDSSGFLFASEIPALLNARLQRPVADRVSVFEYLAYNRTDQTERTFFEGIQRLQHGHILEIDLSGESPRVGQPEQWYNLRRRVDDASPLTEPGEFLDLFASAIQLRLRSDVPVGVCLSGGLDSSSIASLLIQRFNKSDLQSFTASYPPGAYGDEREFTSELESQIYQMHHTFPDADSLRNDLDGFVLSQGEPVPSTSPYAQYCVMRLAKGNVVVTLDGQGADELLAGYHYFFGFLFKELTLDLRPARLVSEIVAYLRTHRSAFGLKAYGYLMLPAGLRRKASVASRSYIHPSLAGEGAAHPGIADTLYGSKSVGSALLDHFEHKLEHLLKWEDRNSMWHSLEARVPFLDHRLVERILASPGDRIVRGGSTKVLLREGMKGILPEKIRIRQDKMGFGTPQDEWFRSPPWIEHVSTVIGEGGLEDRGIIRTSTAQRMHQRHLSGATNSAKELWKLIHLDAWYRRFIDA